MWEAVVHTAAAGIGRQVIERTRSAPKFCPWFTQHLTTHERARARFSSQNETRSPVVVAVYAIRVEWGGRGWTNLTTREAELKPLCVCCSEVIWKQKQAKHEGERIAAPSKTMAMLRAH